MIDSGQPEDMQDVFVVKGEASRSHEINEKGFHGELCSSDRSGQPEITPSVIEARNLSENTRDSKLTMDQGNLMSVTAQQHTQ